MTTGSPDCPAGGAVSFQWGGGWRPVAMTKRAYWPLVTSCRSRPPPPWALSIYQPPSIRATTAAIQPCRSARERRCRIYRSSLDDLLWGKPHSRMPLTRLWRAFTLFPLKEVSALLPVSSPLRGVVSINSRSENGTPVFRDGALVIGPG